MSGAHVKHRTPSSPMLGDSGEPVRKTARPPEYFKAGCLDLHAIKRTLKPNGEYRNGRPTGYTVMLELKPLHVLDYRPEPHRVSKHAAGRIRPRTPREQRRAGNLTRRYNQARKSLTIDSNALAGELAA